MHAQRIGLKQKTTKKQRFDRSKQTRQSSPEMSASTEYRTERTVQVTDHFMNKALCATYSCFGDRFPNVSTSEKLRDSKQLHSFFSVSSLIFTRLLESRSLEKMTVQV